MRCVMCGSQTTASVATERPLDLGLPGIRIGGVTVHTCPKCGEEYDELPPPEALLQAVTDVLAERVGVLSGPEIRFLRKRLGWSRKDFAEQFCVDPTTVSKWENGHVGMDAFKEKMLRLLARRGSMLDDYGHDIDPDRHGPPFKLYVPGFEASVPVPVPRSRAAGR